MQAEQELTGKRAERKAAGVFYTPAPIVEYILGRTLAAHDVTINPAPQVLDPACGSGNFLIAAYEMLMAKFVEKLRILQQCYAGHGYKVTTGAKECWLTGQEYWQRHNLHYHIIRHCLYGADIDAKAVAEAQARLVAKAETAGEVYPNLVIADSLVKWETAAPTSPDFPEPDNKRQLAEFWSRQYDYVVGNPPYVSFGLNRVGKIAAAQSAYLRSNYPHSAQYKLSYYALFLERGIMALKPGGYLGFIIPDSYLLGRYYSRIREYILATCSIQELTLVEDKVFRGVLVGFPSIIILRRRQADKPAEAAKVSINKLKAGSIQTSYQYGQEYFSRQVYKRFRLFFSAKDKDIIDKLDQAPCRLGEAAKIRTGMRSLTGQANIKSKTKQGDTWHRGLVSSAQVLPFCLMYQEDWLDVNPDKLNKGGWDKTVIAGPKAFLRQTGDSLIAAIDRAGYYHLNNIHSLTITDNRVSLDYLVGILNSRLMNFYYQTVTLEKGRSMAQVDIELVEKLPLIVDDKQAGRLAALAAKIAGLGNYLEVKEAKVLYEELNTIVYEIYGLSPADIRHVEQTMAGYVDKRKEQ